jgi:hypothetical protein
MKMLPMLPALAALLAGCGGPDKYAENAATPDLAAIGETPGDWSQVALMAGRTPDESGLLQQSQISVDLNALLGRDSERFRTAMAGAGPLVRDGPALITIGRSRQAYLVIVPSDHALHAGFRTAEGWRTFRTPGAEVPRVAALKRLLQS